MSCSQYSRPWIQAWKDFAFQDAILCPYSAQFGGLEFVALLTIGAINMAYYGRQDSILMPFVVTILTGGFFIQYASSVMSQMVIVAIVFAAGVGPVLIVRYLEGESV